MRVPLELAETLAAIVDEGTLDAAAARLHLTPSAVSQRLKTLERQVGRVLLERTKPARATAAGLAVVRYARQLSLLEHDVLAELGDPEAGRVSVPLAVNADSLATWFLDPLARLSRTRPVVFELHRDDQDFTAGLLESGAVMAAVTSRADPVAGPVLDGKCEVVLPCVDREDDLYAIVRKWLPDNAVSGTQSISIEGIGQPDRARFAALYEKESQRNVLALLQIPTGEPSKSKVYGGDELRALWDDGSDQDLQDAAFTKAQHRA